jgi:hypothetical protein
MLSTYSRLAIALALLCTACASARSRPGGPGTYRFVERLYDVSPALTLEGVVLVESDTVTVESSTGLCWYDRNASVALDIVYRCGEATFRLVRDDPINRFYYAVRTMVRRSRRTCARYTDDSRRTCAEWRTEIEEVPTTRSGRLHLRRSH